MLHFLVFTAIWQNVKTNKIITNSQKFQVNTDFTSFDDWCWNKWKNNLILIDFKITKE